ncbi:hypothetical protein [Micromonospora rubida]
MTTVLVIFGSALALAVAAFAVVAWRDRQRQSTPEDSAAARAAASTQERYAAERHGAQGEVWQRGRTPEGSG